MTPRTSPRRLCLGLLMLAIMLSVGGVARAQALKQLPPNPFAVVKFNNLEELNKKIGALNQKLGVANIEPALGDPLGALRQALNLNEGFDPKGEMAIAFYEPPQGAGDEPRVIALLPVSDYAAFTKGLPNAKEEGKLATFTLPDDDDPMFATNWGTYAAIADKAAKDLLGQQPTGVEITGAAAAKQAESQDVVVFVNMPAIKARFSKEWQQHREEGIAKVEKELAADENFPKQFAPAAKAFVGQMFSFVDQLLNDGQAVTFGMTVSEKGINLTGLAEFTPTSNFGQTLSGIKNTDEPLVAGLPNRKYFSYGGLVSDPAAMEKVLENVIGPVQKELEAAGEEGKPFLDFVQSTRTMLGSVEAMSFGYVAPQGNPGQEPLFQQIFVTTGKAQQIADAQKQQFQTMANMLQLVPEAQGKANFNVQPAAKTVDGVALDQMTFELKLDPNSPESAQMAQMMQMMYGGNGMSGYVGVVDPQTHIGVFGGEGLLNESVAAAKAKDNALVQGANVQAVIAELPKTRAAAYYVAVDNIITAGLQFAGQQGFPVNVKLPPDMPPIGMTMGTEGSAGRFDIHISSDLLQQLISTGMQTMMMMQGGGGGGRGNPPGGQL